MANAMYAGSFDPFTNGHLSIIKKASKIFDTVYVAIANNSSKTRKYYIGEMVIAIEKTLEKEGINNVKVVACDKMVADLCTFYNCEFIVRGIRNNIDYNYEENIAEINKEVNPNVETIYLRADEKAISSSMVKELFSFKKDVSKYVPEDVLEVLMKK